MTAHTCTTTTDGCFRCELNPDELRDHPPKRIQRRRTRGWRMPEGAVYVGRPTRWGNPFPVGAVAVVETLTALSVPQQLELDAELSVVLYRAWLDYWPGRVAEARRFLAGRDLACWCPLDAPCHGDVLLEIANGGAP